MDILSTIGWDDYALLDSGNGRRLEKFGKYILSRPDPQAIWLQKIDQKEWDKADAVFGKLDGREKWIIKTSVPEKWLLQYKNISFYAKLSPFKHTGIFPEQSLQWDWMEKKLLHREKSKVLNLFAYTGIASLICGAAGAEVTHVDASSSAIGWARENQKASHLEDKPIRWILDDVMKFVEREIKRGNTYDGIIMDPPIYGHGAHGETWDLMKDLPILMELCQKIISPNPLFILVNAYAISASSLMLGNVLSSYVPQNGKISVGELALEEKLGKRLLSTGIFARFESL